jgi:hypothetical protein
MAQGREQVDLFRPWIGHRLAVVVLVVLALVARSARAQPQQEPKQADTAKAELFEERRAYFERGKEYYESVLGEIAIADRALNAPRPPPRGGFLPLPVLFYGPETDLGFGAFGMYYRHLGDLTDRTSSIRSSITGTTKGQFQFDIGPDLWLAHDVVHVYSTFLYKYFPDSFFGIGYRTPNSALETYTERTFSAGATAQMRIVSKLFAGVKMRAAHHEIEDIVPGKQLASGAIVGASGGWVVGAGPTVTYDDRDNLYAASRGSYVDLQFLHQPAELGTDHTFSYGRADLRQYLPLGRQVLAFQIVGEAAGGATPFNYLPRIGGRSTMRGIFYGRYRDNIQLEGQTEFRLPVFWRFGAVGFLATGEVAHDVSKIRPQALYVAGGGGLRFAIVPEERINIRLDFAYGPQGLAYYLDLGEAF